MLALHHARHRHAFQKPLVDQPAMRRVLADLALESEAQTALSLRLAAAFEVDESGAGEDGVEVAGVGFEEAGGDVVEVLDVRRVGHVQIGRASCRERV